MPQYLNSDAGIKGGKYFWVGTDMVQSNEFLTGYNN
jgi:hypothetical protein